jgi:hypothetical protein
MALIFRAPTAVITKYRAFGHFYKNVQGESCRRYLDIKEEPCTAPQPELIMLMLYPGSCGQHDDKELNQDIEVEADPMIRCIEEFMMQHRLSWVRLLSLSDLEEESTELFFEKLGQLEPGQIPLDSVFHPSRKADLFQSAEPHTPFLLAEGLDKRTQMLGNTAVKRLKEEGYPIINENGLHLQPLAQPNKSIPAWLEYTDKAYRAYLALKQTQEQKPDKAQERENLSNAFNRFIGIESAHLVITAANDPARREAFSSLVSKAGLKPFLGTASYDYIYVDRLSSAKDLFDLLKQHNEKKVIIDAAIVADMLQTPGVLELIEEATCSPTDRNAVPLVGQGYVVQGREPFRFRGRIALLIDESADELKVDDRFQRLLRHCIVV